MISSSGKQKVPLPTGSCPSSFPNQRLQPRMNHTRFTHDQFLDSVKQARANKSMSVQASDEVQVWNAPDGSGAGCVAQLSRFTLTDKSSGTETKSLNLTVANVQVREGKRMLVELTGVA